MMARPARARAGGQGFRLAAEERVAIERRAMEVATKCLERPGVLSYRPVQDCPLRP